MSLNENSTFSVYDRLVPCSWSDLLTKSADNRARCFFVPNIDDLKMVSLIKKEIRPSVFGEASPAQCRGTIMCLSGIRTEEMAKSFDSAMDWWHSLLHGSRRYVEGFNPDLKKVWPNIKLTCPVGACCERCSALDGVIVPRSSLLIKQFYPPWHLGCHLFVTNATRKEAITNDDIVRSLCAKHALSRLYNPVDFAETWGLVPQQRVSIFMKLSGMFKR